MTGPRCRRLVIAAVVLGLLGLAPVAAGRPSPAGGVVRNGSVYAAVTPTGVRLGNPLVERRWERAPFVTTAIVDKRGRGAEVAGRHRDFSLTVAGVPVGSDQLTVTDVAVAEVAEGLAVHLTLEGPGLVAERVVEAFNGVAGFRTRTTLRPTATVAVHEAVLEEAAVGAVPATIHAFRAGADWREPDWPGPAVSVGDPHAGTWRASSSAAPGSPLHDFGQWLSTGPLFLVMERNDLPSSRASYDGAVASVRAEYARDLLSAGPFEEQVHAENPAGGVGRARVVPAGGELALEPVFVGIARGADDEAWQFFRYLTRHRLPRYDTAVTFNSNGTDSNRISTGAKDDLDHATILEVAPIARRLGVETFILDDGWQAVSGDWEPDSPEHREPRQLPPRFPDARFEAVRDAIAPMALGLWMSPLHFHPRSATYQQHPEWVCQPVGGGTAVYNTLDQESGSNEAGIGLWGPAAIPHVEERLRTAITEWGARYFKFDFLLWADCAGQGDLYDLHDGFLAMVDRLQADHPAVTFQIDETNDYRLFPFESVVRGPSWFQNGTPPPERLLHNIWNLSPYVPSWSLGQHALGGRAWERYPVDTLLAASLLSHITFFSDIRTFPDEVVDRTGTWMAFYKAHRAHFTEGVVYPLLGDPVEGGWTALQAWDPERGRGALLAFRQDAAEPSATVALRNVPPGRVFDLRAAPTGEVVATVTSDQLRHGLTVEIPEPRGARVLLIDARP